MAISHANCTHPRTPAGRRACRNQSSGKVDNSWAGHLGRAERAHAEAAGLVRPRRTEKPVRIQPRRSGARVAARGSACVQAALHIDAHGGRCACGWIAEKVA